MDGFDIATKQQVWPETARLGLGLIGVGAFGAFCLPHLARWFDVHACDPYRDIHIAADCVKAHVTDLASAAAQDVVLLAVPVRAIREVAREIAPYLRPGTLVIDACSLKTAPAAALAEELPPAVDIVGTHPLFGPQSGRDGLAGLPIAVCSVRGRRTGMVARFLRDRCGLHVLRTTAAEHDRQMAYVQGLTHLIARIVLRMEIPPVAQMTTTFRHLMQMVDTVRYDSEALFRAIARDNPFAREVAEQFFEEAAALRCWLNEPAG